nr:S8 family serine peptidase [Kribbella sandramycini]
MAQATAAQPGPARAGKAQVGKTAQPATVTLVTGDRVIVRADGRATVQPGKGREHVKFKTYKVKDHLYVVPSDVFGQLASGRLDRRLFDVTGLIKAKYDDKSAKTIPVIVTYAGKAKQRAAAPGATVTRQLPVVNGAALKVDKAKAAEFLTGSAARSAAGIDKIWLDGKRELFLDKSVPQIGAPTAWAAGFTGKDVKVAVLDTGVDDAHPDLATQVAEAKTFIEEPVGDTDGHGTHVSSTILGTGAASGGKYKGVAPDAKLYSGKVCGAFDCPESSILAGMEWAANEVKAKVVNLSLGGQDTPEIDPLEAAVNQLTEQTGTLFVIAAGNSGLRGPGSIGSPGSAEAALTVGAVDKQDKLAYFSSLGPRVGDGGVKPDVTAPGVDIVAARSKDSALPGDKYFSASGTSMATPHTVGAAAILAQQHPEWKAAELKAALMASAKPAPELGVFQQGTGRIDVAKGIKQTVVTDPGTVSFGTAIWPHDDDTPVTKTLTYRNLGSQTVTLNLAATFTDPAGNPAPAGAFALSANSVTVPAGGTASVQVTSNTKHNGPDGAYSGRVTATGGDATVISGLGVNKEVESYNYTLKALDRQGKPAEAFGSLFGPTGFVFLEVPADGATVRLPKGSYVADTSQYEGDPEDPASFKSYSLVEPGVKLTKDVTSVHDARKAKPLEVAVAESGVESVLATYGFVWTPSGGQGSLDATYLGQNYDGAYTAQVGPALPPEQMTGYVSSQWAKPGADGRFRNSPVFYGQMDPTPGAFPTGLARAVKGKELAQLDQHVNVNSDRLLERVAYAAAPNLGGGWGAILEYDQPTALKAFVDDKPATWSTGFSEVVPSADPENPFPDLITDVQSPFKGYQARKKYDERFHGAAFSTAPNLVIRDQDYLLVLANSLLDGDGNAGFTRSDSGSSKLLRNGELIGEFEGFGNAEAFDLPAGKATYQLQTTQSRESISSLSTRTDLTYTFTSAATDKETPIPIAGLQYSPKVDDHNVADRTPVTVLPITLVAQRGVKVPAVKKLELQVSGDDGKTWHKAAVAPSGKGAYKAIFGTPKGAKTISLKAHLVDAQGNITDQTTIGAYPLR